MAGAEQRERSVELPVVRSSFVWKLALFVGLLIGLTAALLGWTGYRFTRAVLVDQIQDRLSVVAATRQAAVLAYTKQQKERANLIASRTRLRELVELQIAGSESAAVQIAELSRYLTDSQKSLSG